MDLDNPTEETITKLIDKCGDAMGEIVEWRDTLIDDKLELLGRDELRYQTIVMDFIPAVKQNVKDVVKLVTFTYTTLLYTRYYHTGEERYREAAFTIISREDLRDILDDKPDLELVE